MKRPEMRSGETPSHRHLKRLALRWAAERGFAIGSTEVAVPRLGFCRLDVAAYRPPAGRAGPEKGAIAVFECKQARADFLRDTRCEAATLARLTHLAARQQVYEEFLRRHHPHLRMGEELFPEFDAYHFEQLGYEPYDRMRSEQAALSRRLHGCTKFSRLARWRAAHLHYVVAEQGVARLEELPAGWGLLVRQEDELRTEVTATWQEIPEENCTHLLLRIAKCATRALVRSLEDELTPGAASPQPRPPHPYVQRSQRRQLAEPSSPAGAV